MRVLITRPREDAAMLAAELERTGVDTVVEPLLEIVAVAGAAVDLDGVQAILVSSANGARALARATAERGLPVFAVGDATAARLRALGFHTVESARGDAAALAALVGERLDPAGGTLLHATGRNAAGRLAETLAEQGFEVRRAVLYEARPAASFSEDLRRMIERGEIDAVLFFSPRTAETFVSLARGAGLEPGLSRIVAICLSPAVAEAAGTVAWRDVRSAGRPEASLLLDEVDALATASELEPSVTDKPIRDEDAAGTPEAESAAEERAAEERAAEALAAAERTEDRAEAARDAEDATAAEAEAEAKAAPEAEGPSAPFSGPPPLAPAEPAASGRGLGAAIAAAILTTVVVLAAVTAFAWLAWPDLTGLLRPAGVEALTARVTSLERALGEMRENTAADAAALRARITALEQGGGDGAAALEGRVAALERAVEGLRERPAPAADDARLTALEERLAKLESAEAAADGDRLAALAKRVDQLQSVEAAADGGRLAALTERLDALASRLEAAETERQAAQQAAAQAEAAADTLNTRLAALEEATARLGREQQAETRGDALLLAVGQLRDALRGPRPYASELAAVRELAGDDEAAAPAIDALAAHAATGVPTVEALASRFPATARAVARAAVAPDTGDWLDRTLSRLASVVTIRRTGEAAPEGSADAALDAAEAALKSGDLATAVAALGALSGPAAKAAAPWLADARARLAAERAAADLAKRAVAGMAPRKRPEGGG